MRIVLPLYQVKRTTKTKAMKKQIKMYNGWEFKSYKLALSIYGIDTMISIKGGLINSTWL